MWRRPRFVTSFVTPAFNEETHQHLYGKPLGPWRISETEQVPVYPDELPGQVDREEGETSLASCKGPVSWTSTVARIIQSSGPQCQGT